MAMLPAPSGSLEEIKAANVANDISIGMFRPKAIRRLVKEHADPWTEKERAALRQERLGLGEEETRELSELEQIPWKFSYEFDCEGADCRGHKLQIFDWELGQSYRRWSRSDPTRWEEMIRQKYERELPARDLHLVVGTLAAHPKTFVIIGLVYHPGRRWTVLTSNRPWISWARRERWQANGSASKHKRQTRSLEMSGTRLWSSSRTRARRSRYPSANRSQFETTARSSRGAPRAGTDR